MVYVKKSLLNGNVEIYDRRDVFSYEAELAEPIVAIILYGCKLICSQACHLVSHHPVLMILVEL